MPATGSRRSLFLFFILIAAVALGNGLSDAVYANYFKEVYDITAGQRAFIEFPRELPGLLCALIIAVLSPLGDLRITFIAQILACAGLTVLGLFTPPFAAMLVFLFVNSLGMHLFFPLQDSVGMELAEPDRVGKRMGQYKSLATAVGFAAGILVFFGFRYGFFSFKTAQKPIFLIGSAAFFTAAAVTLPLMRSVTGSAGKSAVRKIKLIFRREYVFFYILSVLHGIQKQIAYVFGSWVLVDLLLRGADIMSLLIITSGFFGIFFLGALGRLIDRLGVKKVMYLDALTFIIIYLLYGFVVWGITSSVLPSSGWPVMTVYVLFVADRLSMQIGVVKSVYLRRIAVSPGEITPTLSAGTSLDHVCAILAAQLSGSVWTCLGPQWVFFMAAFFSLGNLFVAWRVKE
jgi:predicted MFS family arabinose efflux permease